MLKKSLYVLLALIVVYFLYTIFYKKIDSPVAKMEKEMKAKNVVYRLKDDAVIYADEQIGTNNDDIIKFKGVTVDLLKKNMLIAGKEAEVNTKTSDIKLEKEVVGRTKDRKWELYTERVNYYKEGERLVSDTRSRVVNTEEKREMEADKIETTIAFEQVVGTGNVIFKAEPRQLNADKLTYNATKQEALGEGNVKYKDDESNISANRALYWIEKKQVDATGNVIYQGKDLGLTANHVFYDEVAQKAEAAGNGTYNYAPKKTTGTFQSGNYDLKQEILTTNQAYTMNYEDYKMKGVGLVYLFKTGDATFNSNFSITKQNFTVSGINGTMNTVARDIFANKMVMTSVQGDRVTSDTGNGSFEKKEFRFDGNVNGKIRGNVKDFINSPVKLVDSEAIHFKGNTAKMYFISQGDNMSITRSEIKENVHMVYKEVILDSQYNEIDAFKNLVLARDKVIMDFRNETQLTSNFMYLNLNTEIGTAQDNVKIVSKTPKYSNINTSSDKAVVNMKTRKVDLQGNVLSYQGKTRISSNNATYDMDKKIMENTGNIKMQYQVQNNTNATTTKSDPKNVAAVSEIANKLGVSQSEINAKEKVSLPKSETASNGVQTIIKWTTSNPSLIDVNGAVNKQFYGGSATNVTLRALVQAGADRQEKVINVKVPVETKKEMLERATQNISTTNGFPRSVIVNVHKGTKEIPITWEGRVAVLTFEGETLRKQF